MTTILEAFGHLADTGLIRAAREEEQEMMQRAAEDPAAAHRSAPMSLLHWLLEARAELMGWSSLWEAYDADVVPNARDTDPPAGWAYLRLTRAEALPALFQCFEDSPGRMAASPPGITGFQLASRDAAGFFPAAVRLPGEQWFSTRGASLGPVPVVLSFDGGFLSGRDPREFASTLERSGAKMLDAVEPVSVPAARRVREPLVGPGAAAPLVAPDVGVSVMMPEWSAAAWGWLFTFCAWQMGRTGADPKAFAVRITLG